MSVATQIRRFAGDARASVAMISAVVLLALLMAAGMALDYASAIRQRAELQAAADSAAIAGAKEIPLALTDTTRVQIVAESFARTNLGMSTKQTSPTGGDDGDESSSKMMMSSAMMMSSDSTSSGSGGSGGGNGSATVNALVIEEENTVAVTISAPRLSYFGGILPGADTISVTARAQTMGMGKICVLGLMESSLFAGVHIDNSAALEANECGVYSNSTSFASIRADASATMTASMICAAGGYWAQSGSSFTPEPTTDCPPIPDPLSDRPAPDVGSCTAMGLVVDVNTTLDPGTYCGGLSVTNGAAVTLRPGIYVIKDGPLAVQGASSLTGENVGFYLTGNDSLFDFEPDTTIDLVAPADGPMAGLLFMEDNSLTGARLHRIQSNNARQLLGTIYLPKSILQVDADAPVADQSAYTAIVVMRLWLQEGPTLVLNSDYSATEVPVPAAISGGRVVLTQ